MSTEKKKQIVFVNQSSGYLMIDIIHAFDKDYEESILMTGFLNPRNKSLNPNVTVENLAKYNRDSSLKRIYTWSLAFIKAVYLIKWKYPKADLFLVSNPPMATLLPLFCKNPFIVLIYDIYPDALLEFKIFKSDSSIIKYWKIANKKVYSRAIRIYTLTEGMKNKLRYYVSTDKIEVVPIWTDNEFLKPIDKQINLFTKQQKWEDKFVVMYSGNLGKSHPVEIMVELAKYCTNPKIHFVIIGGGDKYKEIEKLIVEAPALPISIMPWLPTEQLPLSLSAADVGVVTIGNEAIDLSIPSKTFNILSVGKPIISICAKEAALAHLIQENKCGESFELSQRENILNYLDKLCENKMLYEFYSENAIRTSKLYTSENAKMFL